MNREATQFRDGPYDRECHVVLGLDFGTSCSKVVIQTPYDYGRRALAVPFGELAHASSRFLRPTRVWREGRFYVPRGDAGDGIDGLKWGLRHAPVPASDPQMDPALDAVAYLALVLRESRVWFLRAQEEAYGRFELAWHCNLGVPSAGYDDAAECDRFRRAVAAAWHLSTIGREISVEDVQRAWTASASEGDAPGVQLDVIPEVAAEVVGYARSPRRQLGLHVLVDVGASSLDICGFRLHKDQEGDMYWLLSADVQRLGVQDLHRHRLERMRGRWPLCDEVRDLWDPMAPIPRNCEEYVPQELRKEVNWQIIEGDFLEQCERVLQRILLDLKHRKERWAWAWEGGLPVFLAGGGSNHKFYVDAVDNAIAWFREHAVMPLPDTPVVHQPPNVYREPLPGPGGFEVQERLDFQRLAVAYGLSHPSIDIGRIYPPDGIGPMPPRPVRVIEDWYIGPEQV